MNPSKKISVSLLSADFGRLKEEIQSLEAAGADWLHLDVMDGHFVPNLTFGPLIVEKIRSMSRLPLDVHLMLENPDRHLNAFIDAGADWLTVHIEACTHLHRTLTAISERGVRAGVALNPHTPVGVVETIVENVSMVLLMSVNPGFGGQSFIPFTLQKAYELQKIRTERSLSFMIQMDGGIKKENITQISQAGVDVFVVGSGVFIGGDYQKAILELKQHA